MYRILALGALLAAAPSWGQTNDLQQLLSGKDIPHSLKLKELTPEWRHVTISSADQKSGAGDMMKQLMQLGMMGEAGKGKGQNDAAGAMAAMSLFGGLFGGSEEHPPVYYTQGKTASIGGETFLIAYRLDVKAPNLMELAAQSQKEGGKDPDFSKLSAASKPSGESLVTLTLVNVRSIGTMGDIRPFDLNREIEEGSKASGMLDLLSSATPQNGKTDTPTPEVSTEPAGADAGVAAVRLAVQSDSHLTAKGNKIEVAGATGKVVLKGAVTSANLKTRAENIARKALKDAGVTAAISNQLIVR